MSVVQLCRLCARHNYLLLKVTSSNSDGFALVDLIYQYLAIEVDTVDGQPALVCTECSDTLTMFHRFAGQCRDAQYTLRHQLAEYKVEQSGTDEDFGSLVNCTDKKIVLKSEDNIKQEKEDYDIAEREAENFEYSEECEVWTGAEPHLVPLKILKRSRNYPLENESDPDYLSGQEFMKLENSELKCEALIETDLKPTRRYKKRHKKTVDDKRMKRIYRKSIKFDLYEDPVPLLCYFCGQNCFDTKSKLRKHEKSHLELDKTYPWPCLKCDKMFKGKQSAVRHTRFVHDGVTEFVCDACGRTFHTRGNLDDHLTTHSDVMKFECDKCGKKFKLKDSLKRHLDTHQDTVYQCPKCAQLLNSQRTLRNHLYTHDKVGRQECGYCGKRFKLRKTLKVHMLTHTGERPYKCPWCPKTFTNNSNCRIHKKRVHMVELLKFEAERTANQNNK